MNTCPCGRTFMDKATLANHMFGCPSAKEAVGPEIETNLVIEPWLEALIDQRLALMREHAGGPAGFKLYFGGQGGVVMTPVTEPREEATKEEYDRWDRTCDRCGKYVKPTSRFWTGHIMRNWEGVQICFTYGVCRNCKLHPEVKSDG